MRYPLRFRVLVLLLLSGCSSRSALRTDAESGIARRTPAQAVSVSAADETRARNRLANRSYPSVFQAWSPAKNLNRAADSITSFSTLEKSTVTLARHDLILQGFESWKLRPSQGLPGQALQFTPDSVTAAKQLRAAIFKLNPNAVLIAEIRYHDAKDTYLPPNSLW